MLLRILLVTSIACLTNDTRHRFQKRYIAISLSKHLGIAITGLLIPTALSMVTAPNATDIVKQSRGVCVVLMSLYALYLYSEWSEYSLLGLQSSESKKKRGKALVMTEGHLAVALAVIGGTLTAHGRPSASVKQKPRVEPVEPVVPDDPIMNPEATTDEPTERELQLHFWVCVGMLVLVGVLLALHVLFICESIQGIAEERGLSQEFLGLILLPLLGVDSTLLHLDNRYDSDATTQATFGLGLQTILFVTPLLVFVAWIAGIGGMDLLFSPFEVTVLFPAVLVVQTSIEESDKGW
jgi:Ca2+/H+ antiporter